MSKHTAPSSCRQRPREPFTPKSPTRSSPSWRPAVSPGCSHGGRRRSRRRSRCPRNASTQRGYSGINVLILWGSVIEHGFSGQCWLTFRQALGLGGHIRKGERRNNRRLCRSLHPGRRTSARRGGPVKSRVPSRFSSALPSSTRTSAMVLPEEVAASVVPPPPGQIEPRAAALIAATGADFRIGGARAYYNTAGDFVQVPPPAAYFEPINWHRTAFHELGHWTGPGVPSQPRPLGFVRLKIVRARRAGRLILTL